MSDQPVSMSRGGPPETVLAAPDANMMRLLAAAVSTAPAERRGAVAAVVAKYPSALQGWAALGRASTPGIEAYMAFRVGYHRGLDQLRSSGWRGSGYVRWEHPANHGFLECLEGLAANAAVIGEDAEAVRCRQFLLQLDPRGRG